MSVFGQIILCVLATWKLMDFILWLDTPKGKYSDKGDC